MKFNDTYGILQLASNNLPRKSPTLFKLFSQLLSKKRMKKETLQESLQEPLAKKNFLDFYREYEPQDFLYETFFALQFQKNIEKQ